MQPDIPNQEDDRIARAEERIAALEAQLQAQNQALQVKDELIQAKDEEYHLLSAQLCQLAAAQSHARVQVLLGKQYRDGRGDSAEAVRLFHLAAEQGDSEAQTELGCMTFAGNGVAKDFAEAVRFGRCPSRGSRGQSP